MRKIQFVVPPGFDEVKLGNFLQKSCGVSSRLLAKLKREPIGIMVNSRHAITADLLRAGDSVLLCMPQDDKILPPADLPLSVLYEDRDLLVIDKPAGMPMYPSPGHDHDSLANAFSNYCAAHGEQAAFRPVYRLDRDTTGIVVLAKHSYAAARLSGRVKKTYLAVCEGVLNGSGAIEKPIGIKEGHRLQRTVRPDGDYALTRWRSLFTGNGYSLLALWLKTGRTHQIRVHLSDCGHPLAGDDFYGGSLSFLCRQALHCAEVRLDHPVTKRRLRIVKKPPKDMEDLIRWMQQSTQEKFE